MPQAPDEGIASDLPSLSGAWDCHVHVFGPEVAYPRMPDRRYTPELADPVALQAHLGRLHIERVVLVQPTPYGRNNTCLLDALTGLGSRARGIVVVDTVSIQDRILQDLGSRGIRGIRMNPPNRVRTIADADGIQTALRSLNATGWQIEVNCTPELIRPLAQWCTGWDVPLVFDHLAGLDPSAPAFTQQAKEVAAIASDTPIWIKLSGADRVCRSMDDYARWMELAAMLSDVMPDRLLWGSDWPHTPLHSESNEVGGFRSVDDTLSLRRVFNALGEVGFSRVMTGNPSRLFECDHIENASSGASQVS